MNQKYMILYVPVEGQNVYRPAAGCCVFQRDGTNFLTTSNSLIMTQHAASPLAIGMTLVILDWGIDLQSAPAGFAACGGRRPVDQRAASYGTVASFFNVLEVILCVAILACWQAG